MKRKLKDSTVEKLVQDRIYMEFCKQLQAENVAAWLRQVTEWEKDTSKPSPYQIPSSGKLYHYLAYVICLLNFASKGMTEAEVKKQLLEEDSGVDAMTDNDNDQHVTAAAMLVALLNLDDHQ